ncbi:Putative RNA recognition motif domain, nucleotide-binding alpha-beta plait domain superfamily [Septoria linicola]|uniref:RNA recognition motif domain, nucleotide-binding alpha-beta plait domain superfamily n=1 Tax=Septoria linicola TaxID=215465 RepID=A0A9Q9ACK1_9PEZI|nr:putative RNA recognition motif domain, nucleotide-binding alpha-beta plait domain superfamily [Septoria linicola]USW47059.1 Putative RNA recognition motif domain, nucleotide-binding alpha-beta plait domain superfamily [Septoria linicola]
MAPAAKRQRLSDGTAAAVSSDLAVAATGSGKGMANGGLSVEQQKQATQKRCSLFVRSLPASTTSDQLTELFSDAYPVKHATAVVDPETKQCKGYGFVTFADAEDAAQAKAQFNGHELDGRKLRIEVAEPRNRDGKEGESAGQVKRKEAEAERQHQPSKLIVRNLPWSIKGPKQLEKLFLSYGKIKKAYVPQKGPGLMAGFGFVIMRGRKNAEKAIEGVNGKEINGRTLAVDWAVEKDAFEEQAEDDDKAEASAGAVDEDGIDEDLMQDDGDSEEDSEVDSDGENDGNESELDEDEEEEEEEEHGHDRSDERSSTLFVRNLPFTCTDEDLEDHFEQFGSTRYARVVMDHNTGRSKGTGFVCFYEKAAADQALRDAPSKPTAPTEEKEKGKDGKPTANPHSILQNVMADPTGQFTLDGRVLQVSRAVGKSDANRLTEEGANQRHKRDGDKRRLYLLGEGTIATNTKVWEQLPPSEQAMREASAKQRKQLIENNPSLHLSLTRLSVRNIPRSITSKDLKDLARQAVVGFATDVKEGRRTKLSKEELLRGGEEMRAAEAARKKSGKGIVRQAKVVFESAGGSKVNEESGAGRSRGYGFIEYYTHRNALMGLRWLNGHAVQYQVKDGKGKLSREEIQDRKKRLIVEFAIENAQVVMRRNEKEQKARARSQAVQQEMASTNQEKPAKTPFKPRFPGDRPGLRKRKRGSDAAVQSSKSKASAEKPDSAVDEKIAKRNQIIGRKRAMRARRKDGK